MQETLCTEFSPDFAECEDRSSCGDRPELPGVYCPGENDICCFVVDFKVMVFFPEVLFLAVQTTFNM